MTEFHHFPTWGLDPEELLDGDINKATGEEISTAMGHLIKLIHDELRLTIPDYEDLSFDEVRCLVTLNSHWGDFDSESGSDNFLCLCPCAVLLSKSPGPKISHLTLVIKIIRVVIMNRRYSLPHSDRVVLAYSISNILDQSGIKPDRDIHFPPF